MPGQTKTSIWEPKQVGVWPFYCTDFCSALASRDARLC